MTPPPRRPSPPDPQPATVPDTQPAARRRPRLGLIGALVLLAGVLLAVYRCNPLVPGSPADGPLDQASARPTDQGADSGRDRSEGGTAQEPAWDPTDAGPDLRPDLSSDLRSERVAERPSAPPKKPDVCPNLPGAQERLPPGLHHDAAGHCVPPPAPPPPDMARPLPRLVPRPTLEQDARWQADCGQLPGKWECEARCRQSRLDRDACEHLYGPGRFANDPL